MHGVRMGTGYIPLLYTSEFDWIILLALAIVISVLVK
jgi:hypothetical protein